MNVHRSLGWRARYVVAFEPTKKDLDVNHPLFVTMSTRNVFQRIWKENKRPPNAKKAAKRAKLTTQSQETAKSVEPIEVDAKAKSVEPIEVVDAKPAAKAAPASSSTSSMSTDNGPRPVCWVEILCRAKQGGEHKFQWVCVDPVLQLVNEPESVERLLYSEKHQIPFKNVKKKIPISYALAAEHLPGSLTSRLTEVTPRYASSWIDSLKSRGVLRGKQTRVKDSERIDKWWASVLKSVNSVEKAKLKKDLQSKGNSVIDAIVLDDDASVEHHDDKLKEDDDHEKRELHASTKDEPIPTSKTAFKSHPIYVIPSVLNANEVLVPDAKKRFCG
jgi:xeroderma pigmentosum group C-complementing protein